MQKVTHIINNQEVSSSRTSKVYNPAKGEVQAEVCLAGTHEVDQAVKTAHAAYLKWRKVTPIRRARVLFRYKQILEANTDELAAIICREHGKTLEDAKGSITRGLEVVEFACGIPQLAKGEYSADVGGGVDSYTFRQPLGVCVGITPFNFPAMVPLWMFPLAVACGNSFVLKISEKVPSTANALARLAQKAGFISGLLNVVHGSRECVESLLDHPLVQAVSFVGSTPIARSIYERAAKNGKRVQALGGAKNHVVIMPDVDIKQAVANISGAAYGSAGERCMAVSTVICIGNKVGDMFVKSMQEKIQTLKIGPGDQANVDMGPLITHEHLQKVKSYVEQGVAEGGKLIVDGRNLEAIKDLKGFFIGPCLFDHVRSNMKIYQEEIFGPVLSVLRMDNLTTAIDSINAHRYGNGVSIFTNHGGWAREFIDKIQVGMVGVNVPIPVPVAYHSFGGWKQSLFGDTHIHGMEGIRFYTRAKVVTQRWHVNIEPTSNYQMPTLS